MPLFPWLPLGLAAAPQLSTEEQPLDLKVLARALKTLETRPVPWRFLLSLRLHCSESWTQVQSRLRAS